MAWMTDSDREKLLERLLQPLPGDHPAGPDGKSDPRLRPEFDKFEAASDELVRFEKKCVEARQFGTEQPPQPAIAFEGTNATEVRWPEVIRRGCLLLEKTKNLTLATRLAEACVYQYGLEGLEFGIALLHGLCKRFWDTLYPLPDPDDLREGELTCLLRLRSFAGKTAKDLLQSRVELTGQRSTLLDLEIARTTTGAAGESVKSVDDLRQEFLATSKEQLLEIYGRADRSRAACQALGTLLQSSCAALQPRPIELPDSFLSPLTGVLDSICKTLRDYAAPGVFTGDAPAEASAESGADASPATAASLDLTAAAPQQRSAALRQLRQVADFFRRTEPHSPVSYAIEQAIRWGGLSLPDLLAELIESDDTRQAFFKRAGIPAPSVKDS